jgi:DNA-binding Lrp family transcriptional regulator
LADDEASTSKKIIMIINQDNNVPIERITNLLNINRRAVAKHMKRLQENGIICRVGGRAIGHWEIVKK